MTKSRTVFPPESQSVSGVLQDTPPGGIKLSLALCCQRDRVTYINSCIAFDSSASHLSSSVSSLSGTAALCGAVTQWLLHFTLNLPQLDFFSGHMGLKKRWLSSHQNSFWKIAKES